ncbi:Drug resistance MFS transporter transporter [Desulfonema limicola]|uniref:Drug resistance MFS transporter transporter n=1 Tax=Desulfonema limicola TaxID=45656 RepID=A0A975GEP5_9BACT|nr:MFS transporter [Desulfonema limicola]QTA78345.1 Drug resistance MFS transporter transporter [Desulfonema limicola]
MEKSETRINKWLIFFVVAVGVFMSTLDGSIVNIALPSIMKDLSASLVTIEWVMMIYLLTVSSLLLSFGRLSDIKSRRWIYTRGLAMFSAGSLFCGMASTAFWLIAARAFQGIGAAMIMSCTQAIIIESFPVSERGKAMGMLGAVVASGLTCGPALGGWILHISSWQTIFYINIPIGILTAFAGARLLKGGKADIRRTESFDLAGAILLAISTGSFLFIITHGHDWGALHPSIICLTFTCIISFAALIWEECRAEHPLLNPSLLKIRLFTMPVLSAMILFASLFSIVFLMPFFLIYPCGFSPKITGYIMVTPFIFLFIFAPLSGALSDRIGSRFLCTLGMTILAASFFFMAKLSPEYSKLSIAWPLALAGIGIAVFTAPNNAAAMSAVPPEYMGVSAGIVATVRNLGMVLGIALSGAIFNNVFNTLSQGLNLKVYEPGLKPIFMESFSYAMTAGGIVAGIGVIVTYLRGPEIK